MASDLFTLEFLIDPRIKENRPTPVRISRYKKAIRRSRVFGFFGAKVGLAACGSVKSLRPGIQALGIAALLIIASQSSRAASATWLNTGTNATWNTSSNWAGGVAPGSNATDIATFNSAVGTVGTVANPIVFPSNDYELLNLVFDTASVGAFNIGTTNGNALEFVSGGGMTMTSTVLNTETVDAPLQSKGTTARMYLINNAAASTAVLDLTGGISSTTDSGTAGFFLEGTNTGNNTESGVIANGGSTGGVELIKLGTGTWVLTAANTFTGGILLGGGDLVLNFGAAGAPVSNILPSGNPLALNSANLSGSFTAAGDGPVANSSTMTLDGAAGMANTQTFGAVSGISRDVGAFHFDLNPGGTVSGTAGTVTLNLGALPAKLTGLTIDFSVPNTDASVYVGTASTAAPPTNAANSSTSNGLFANAVTINGSDFATNDGSTTTALEGLSSSNLDYYTGDTDGAYANLTYTSGTASINSVSLAVDAMGNLTNSANQTAAPAIRFNQAASYTLTIGSTGAAVYLNTGEILVTSNVGVNTTYINSVAAGGGYLAGSGGGGDLDLIQNNTAGILQIGANIKGYQNTTYVTKAGPGLVLLTGTNSYTGLTTVNEGTLEFENEVSLYDDTTTSWTAANIDVAPGAMLALDVGASPNFTAADIQTLETNFAAGATSNGLENGSTLGLDTTYAGGTFVESTALTNSSAGSVGLTKMGTGTLQLTNTNTYTGPTTVQVGTLALSSSSTNNIANSSQILVGDTQADYLAVLDVTGISNASGFQVPSGQTLAGYGTVNAGSVAVTTLSGSTVSPGTTGTVGTLSITTSNLTLSQGTKFLFDLNGVGTSDQLNVAGTLTLNNQQFGDFTFNTLTNVSPGQNYTLMVSNGAIAGNLMNGDTTGYVDGYMSSIDISGDDLLLEIASVPEPSTWTLLLGGMALLMVYQRRRRSS
jgi:fibronectin-binding autotransporter adhesin